MMERPSYDVSSHHMGAPESPHALPTGPHARFPADDLSARLASLEGKLKLEWCAHCGTHHSIAGGTLGGTEEGGFTDSSALSPGPGPGP